VTATIIETLEKNQVEKVVVSLDEFRGHPLIDVRVYAAYSGQGEARPTRKGVSLKIEHLPALIEALTAAAAEARRRGLLPEERSAGAIRQMKYRRRHGRNGESNGRDAPVTPRDAALEGAADGET
jgi:hypothetical protein